MGDIVATEGVRGLYRGVLVMSYKTVLWNTLVMAVKHLLGPSRAMTPPASPCPGRQANPMRVPLMAREPFPAELLTTEKLNEIMSSLKLEHVNAQQRRLDKLEDGLHEVRQEIREVKYLLMDFVSSVSS